jgi:hypothetical protein
MDPSVVGVREVDVEPGDAGIARAGEASADAHRNPRVQLSDHLTPRRSLRKVVAADSVVSRTLTRARRPREA